MRFKEVYELIKSALRCLLNASLVDHSCMYVGKVAHKSPPPPPPFHIQAS